MRFKDAAARTWVRGTAAAVGAAAGLLVIAACGTSAASTPAGASSSTPTSAASVAPAAGSGSSGGSGTVISTASGKDGTYLTGANGKAVYLWVADTSNKSTCSGACAAAWPPVTTKGSPTASGSAVAGDLGTTQRSGGTEQVTYDGHPLYYYAGDSGAGQITGQGSTQFGSPWWLVAPNGSAIKTPAGAAAPSTAAKSSSSGGASWS